MQINLVPLLSAACLLVLALFVACDAVLFQAHAATTYKPVNHAGTCDASAAVAVGSSMFVVANDEDNILRLYHRDGLVNKPVKSLDLGAFLNLDIQHPEADIEAATRVGDRVYWITSHGANKKGKQRRSRHKFFASKITHAGNEVAIEFVGHPYETLIHDLNMMPKWHVFALLDAAHLPPKSRGGLNIEGLAAAPDGSLWIAFRNPVPNAQALLVRLKNPQAVVAGEPAILGEPLLLSLHSLGIRGMEYVPQLGQYLIIAGSFAQSDSFTQTGSFRMYRWSGQRDEPAVFIKSMDVDGFTPETVVVYGDGTIQLLSDDGTKKVAGKTCKRVAVGDRSFQSLIFMP